MWEGRRFDRLKALSQRLVTVVLDFRTPQVLTLFALFPTPPPKKKSRSC